MAVSERSLEMSGEKKSRARRTSRVVNPRSLIVAGLIILVQALLKIGIGSYNIVTSGRALGGLDPLGDLALPTLSRVFLTGAINILIGLVFFWVAVAVLRRRPRAWVLGMSAHSVALVISLIGYLRGHPDYVTMTLGAAAVFYLNLREVRQVLLPAEVPTVEQAEVEAA
jgi:hypothetical protein